nr:MAG TPA: hypothetical protein [Caudoviricetes sp.]
MRKTDEAVQTEDTGMERVEQVKPRKVQIQAV